MPASRNEKYPSPRGSQSACPIITWSAKQMSTAFAASRIIRVKCKSGALGAGSPDGWLWTQIKSVQPARIAARRTSRGWANTAVAVPSVIICLPVIRALRLRKRTQNDSCIGWESNAPFIYATTFSGRLSKSPSASSHTQEKIVFAS